MNKYKNIQTFKGKHNKIIGYRLQSTDGNVVDVESTRLKQAIKSNQVEVVNLTLTSDNRLIERKVDNAEYNKVDNAEYNKVGSAEKDYIREIISKAKANNYSVVELPEGYYEASKGKDIVLIIPEHITDAKQVKRYTRKKVKVLGGRGLNHTRYMFRGCDAKVLDLSQFNTSGVVDMSHTFEDCEVGEIVGLNKLNTLNVRNMDYMFYGCTTKRLDLSNIDTHNVESMKGMFNTCYAKDINIVTLDTCSVTDMSSMFMLCGAKNLDLSNFNTSRVVNMESMFYGAKTAELNLLSFNTTNVKNMDNMFYMCKVPELNLVSFRVKNSTTTRCMFDACKSKVKATDSLLLSIWSTRDKQNPTSGLGGLS